MDLLLMSSPARKMPMSSAMASAVSLLSPVIMITRTPAFVHSPMAAATCTHRRQLSRHAHAALYVQGTVAEIHAICLPSSCQCHVLRQLARRLFATDLWPRRVHQAGQPQKRQPRLDPGIVRRVLQLRVCLVVLPIVAGQVPELRLQHRQEMARLDSCL